MKKNEKVLLGFEAKAKKIIHKYTLIPDEKPAKYGYLRLSVFFAHFNNAFSKVNEELSKESLGILSRHSKNDDVDFILLADRLHEQLINAKVEFIRRQQPLQAANQY